MPTIYDKLEAKIKYHEEQAHAYRIALEGLRADDTAKSKTALPDNLSKAIALRQSTNGHVSTDERQALIEAVLRAAPGPVKVGEIVAALQAQGVVLTRDQVARQLKLTPAVKRTGKFSGARYTLAGTKGVETKKKQPQARPERGAFRDAALYVLNLAKAPLTTDEFRSRIQERVGRKISAVGLGSLVRYGYAKLTSEGYVGTGKEAPSE